jgi:WD40 repeat protein
VWHIKFSHSGKLLASASKDGTAIIWSTPDTETKPIALKTLTGHVEPLTYVSWSPDDTMLLSCGNDNVVKLWDVGTGKCLRTFTKHGSSVTVCSWFPDGKHFVSGGLDKNIFMMDIDGNEIRSWVVSQVNDLAITSDGRFMIVLAQEKKIRIYDIEERTESSIQETDPISSLDLSSDNRYLLCSVVAHNAQEIRLWDLEERKLVQKYQGHKLTRFVVRACFGGVNQAFVASGSEDSQVYVWHKETGTLLLVLPGHSGTVNAVSWNGRNPYMLASCSDDHTIRIWAGKP